MADNDLQMRCDNECVTCVSSMGDIQALRVLKQEGDFLGDIDTYIPRKMVVEEVESEGILVVCPSENVCNLNTTMITHSF